MGGRQYVTEYMVNRNIIYYLFCTVYSFHFPPVTCIIIAFDVLIVRCIVYPNNVSHPVYDHEEDLLTVH